MFKKQRTSLLPKCESFSCKCPEMSCKCPKISCNVTNKRRFFFIWILPWIIALGFGSLFVIDFSKFKRKTTNEEEEPFDWVDVEWDFSSYQIHEQKRRPIKLYGWFIPPVKDSYIHTPQAVKTSYAIVDNCTFDRYGYYIKDGIKYPTQHSWLVPQFEIEEEDKIKYNVHECICLFVPPEFSETDILTKVMHRIIALPQKDLESLPIFTNCREPIVKKAFEWAGLKVNITYMKGAVKAEKMHVLDYPDPNTFTYMDFERFKGLIKGHIGYNKQVVGTIDVASEMDMRIEPTAKESIPILQAQNSKIRVVNSLIGVEEGLGLMASESCLVSFGTRILPLALFMRPQAKLIVYSNGVDFIEGAVFAHIAGAKAIVIGSNNRTMTAKTRKALIDVINQECNGSDDDETETLDLGDIDSDEGEKELLEKEKELMKDKPKEYNPEKQPEREKEVITGEIDEDN